jgi:hypothetical protein
MRAPLSLASLTLPLSIHCLSHTRTNAHTRRDNLLRPRAHNPIYPPTHPVTQSHSLTRIHSTCPVQMSRVLRSLNIAEAEKNAVAEDLSRLKLADAWTRSSPKKAPPSIGAPEIRAPSVRRRQPQPGVCVCMCVCVCVCLCVCVCVSATDGIHLLIPALLSVSCVASNILIRKHTRCDTQDPACRRRSHSAHRCQPRTSSSC